MTRVEIIRRGTCAIAVAASLSFSSAEALAFEGNLAPEIDARTGDYSPFVGRAYPDEVLFEDLHFHTELSFDAGLVGTSLSVHDAFRVLAVRKSSQTRANRYNSFARLIFLPSQSMRSFSACHGPQGLRSALA